MDDSTRIKTNTRKLMVLGRLNRNALMIGCTDLPAARYVKQAGTIEFYRKHWPEYCTVADARDASARNDTTHLMPLVKYWPTTHSWKKITRDLEARKTEESSVTMRKKYLRNFSLNFDTAVYANKRVRVRIRLDL